MIKKTFHQLVKKQRNNGNIFVSDLYIGNDKYTRTQGILDGLKQHFEQLALGNEDVNFGAEYHRLKKYEVSIITEIVKDSNIPNVTMNELEKAIKSINKGKAADMYGLTIEHILAGKDAVIYLLVLIYHIFYTGDMPELLKTGVLTPVFKRKWSKNCSTNLRGITILPVICKIIEAILKERISSQCDRAQNPYQRGFTRNASPMNAGLVIEEFLRESKDNNLTAHLSLLDAKSVFDVMDHDHMLRRFFHIGVQDKHWTLISSLHRDALSVVKWVGEQSRSFKMHQGVHQCSIVSTDLYKIYQNPQLNRIQLSGLGARVGNVTCNISVVVKMI